MAVAKNQTSGNFPVWRKFASLEYINLRRKRNVYRNKSTAVRSQNTFTAAVLEMMKSTAFSKITVKAICEKHSFQGRLFEFFDSKKMSPTNHSRKAFQSSSPPWFYQSRHRKLFYSHIYGNGLFPSSCQNNLSFCFQAAIRFS